MSEHMNRIASSNYMIFALKDDPDYLIFQPDWSAGNLILGTTKDDYETVGYIRSDTLDIVLVRDHSVAPYLLEHDGQLYSAQSVMCGDVDEHYIVVQSQ